MTTRTGFNVAADGGFYGGEGAVAGPEGAISLSVDVQAGNTSNVLCGGAANRAFDGCANGFALRDAMGAEVTLVLLDNGLASNDPDVLSEQLAAPSPCPECPPFTAQICNWFRTRAGSTVGKGRKYVGGSQTQARHALHSTRVGDPPMDGRVGI